METNQATPRLAYKQSFNRIDKKLFWKLAKWGRFRHPRKWWKWVYRRYWQRHPQKETIEFSDGDYTLIDHADTNYGRAG